MLIRRVAAAWAAAAMATAVMFATGSSGAATTYTHGFDVSWPQCTGSKATHLPANPSRFVILGLTYGTGHTTNPCFADQLAWARAHGAGVGAYLVPSYPTAQQIAAAGHGPYGACRSLTCRLHNEGASQAADAIAVMRGGGLAAPMIWVDVEFRSTQPWTGSDAHNRAVIEGVLRGLADAHLRAGIYTTSYMWNSIVGGWRVDVPNWLPSGGGDVEATKRFCTTTGTGGTTWLVQYTHEFDENLTCPVMDPVPGHRSPLWRYRHTTLGLGSSGRAVQALQHALRLARSGSYDAATTVGVLQWQRKKGLPANGSVDRDDWRALGAFRSTGGRPFLLNQMVGH